MTDKNSVIVERIKEAVDSDEVRVSISPSWYPDGREKYLVWIFPENKDNEKGKDD